jgi:hypothetical protein
VIQPGFLNRAGGVGPTTSRCGPHHGPPSEHPGVQRAAYRVHGFSIGTQEPAGSRRLVANRQALWSRARAARGDGAPVVVRGRESRPHGEGGQVSQGLGRRRNSQWTLSIKPIRLGSSTFNASSTDRKARCRTKAARRVWEQGLGKPPQVTVASAPQPHVHVRCATHAGATHITKARVGN